MGQGARSTVPCTEFRLTRHLGCLLAAFALLLLSLGSGARAHTHAHHGHQHVLQHDGVGANHSRPSVAAHHARMDVEPAVSAAHEAGVATHDADESGGGTLGNMAAVTATTATVHSTAPLCLNCGSECNCSGACVGACHVGYLGDNNAALPYAAGAGMVLPARAVAFRPWSTPPRSPPPRT